MARLDTSLDEFKLSWQDGYYPYYHSRARRVTVAESASRLMILGRDSDRLKFEFFWPTTIDRTTVKHCIGMAGIILDSATYGMSRKSGSKLTTSLKLTDLDGYIPPAQWRTDLLDGIVGTEMNFTELDTFTEGYTRGVEWVQAFDNGDFSVDQIKIGTDGTLALTESWVQALVKSTAAEPWISQNAEALTASLQNAMIGESVLTALQSE